MPWSVYYNIRMKLHKSNLLFCRRIPFARRYFAYIDGTFYDIHERKAFKVLELYLKLRTVRNKNLDKKKTP